MLAGQAHPRDRRPQRRVDRVLDRAARAGAGRRGDPELVRAGDAPHRAHGQAAPEPRRADRRARRHRTRTTSRRSRATSAASSTASLHSLAFAPESCLGGGFLDAPWEDVAVALHVSAYSLKALAVAALPLMEPGRVDRRPRLRQRRRRLAGLRLDGRRRRRRSSRSPATSPATSARRASGCNLVSAGPSGASRRRASPASRSSRRSGSSAPRSAGTSRTPSPIAKACVALLSDWFPATTGEKVHVDGGFHAVGA